MEKILFITQDRSDAIWITDKNIIKELKKHKHNFDFLVIRKKWSGAINIIFNYFYNIFLIVFKSFKYKRVFFTWQNPYVIFLRLIYWGKFIIMTVHHVEDYWWKSFVWKLIFKSVDRFIAISNFTKKQLINHWVNWVDILVNYNWIGDIFYYEKDNDLEKLNYILYIWTEVKRKNFETLLLAFRDIIKNFPDVKLMKIWASWDKSQEEKINNMVVELGIEDSVVIDRKRKTDWEIRRYYSNSLIYVSLSNLEWFWLTIPEAMACKCPVIASGIDPFREILWEMKYAIVDQNDIESVKLKIEKYLWDKSFREKMWLEWKKLSRKFSWEKNVETLLDNIHFL